MDQRTCAPCGRAFSPTAPQQRYCSPSCKHRAKYLRKVGRPANDLAGRHCRKCGVNIDDRQGKARQCRECKSPGPFSDERPCLHCGVTFTARQRRQMYCSAHCRYTAKNRKRPPKGPTSRARRALSALKPGPHSRIWIVDCAECGATFTGRAANAKVCSTECRNARCSAKVMGFYNLAITELDIPRAMMWRRRLIDYLRHRDGDRCGICATHMDFDKTTGARGETERGATIDHVIPRSKGGPDDLANLRLAHWSCNRNRGNRGDGEQLRLVG